MKQKQEKATEEMKKMLLIKKLVKMLEPYRKEQGHENS